MRRGRRDGALRRRPTLIAGCAVAAAMLAAGAAEAAERKFELVTPAGGEATGYRFQLADQDGDWAYYTTDIGSDGVPADGGGLDGFGAQRTAAGWAHQWLTPYCIGDLNVHDGESCTSPFQGGIQDGLLGGKDGEILFATFDDIVAPDSNFNADVYRSGVNGATLVTEGQNGAAGGANYSGTVVSQDASAVAWVSGDRLVPSDDDDLLDLYVVRSGTLTRASGVPGCGPACQTVEAPSYNRRALSTNGERVTFVAGRAIAVEDTDDRYDVYVNDADGTRLLSPDTPQDALHAFSTPDGRMAYWVSSSAVLPEDTDTAVDVYATDVTTGDVSLVSAGTANVDAQASAAAADGSLAVFATTEQLAGSGAPADGSLKLYATEGATSTYIASLDDPNDPVAMTGGTFPGPIAVADDGSSVVFSTASSLVGADGNTAEDVYRWTPSGGLTLLSPRRAGEESGDARFLPLVPGFPTPQGPGGFGARFGPGMTPDGAQVFFDSDVSLVDGDRDGGFTDVYEWSASDGLRLVTPVGSGAFDARYTFNTADGRDVFFESDESITGWDTDGGETDIYVARLGGGFPEPPAGDVGQPTGGGGPASTPPAPQPATTAPAPVEPVTLQPPSDHGGAGSQAGDGDPAEATVDRRRLTRTGRTLRVAYEVTGDGTLRARLVKRRGGKLLARGSSSVEEGDATVRLRLTRAGRRATAKGRVRAVLVTRFVPDDGDASRTRTRVVVQSEGER